MAETEITIQGLDLVLRGVDAFARAADEEITKALHAALSRVGRQLAVYPPPLRYQRTGTLGRGWTNATPRIERGVGTLTNATPYASYVQGENQARIHVGRWRTVQQVLNAMEPEIQDTIDGAMDTALRRVGLQGL